MNLGALRAALRAEMAARLATGPADPAHDLSHLDRVWTNAQEIAAGEGLPPSAALVAAAYLHDLVNLPKDHPDRGSASRRSAEAAVPLMTALGLDPAEVEDAAHAIAAHSFSAGIAPRTLLARVVQDADRLESLGAIGIARTLLVGGRIGRPLLDGADPFARRRPTDDGRFCLDHFEAKLLRLAEGMTTATGRRMAAARTTTLRHYLSALAQEIGETDCPW